MGLGTDTLGSVRTPAACCGVSGIRPTTGLVPTEGVLPLSWTLDQVGPLARSKRLRMRRAVHAPTERVVFERSEVDGKRHSPWVLESAMTEQASGEVELTMTLTYGGNLWTGAILERVLDDHVERGARSLTELLAGGGGSRGRLNTV